VKRGIGRIELPTSCTRSKNLTTRPDTLARAQIPMPGPLIQSPPDLARHQQTVPPSRPVQPKPALLLSPSIAVPIANSRFPPQSCALWGFFWNDSFGVVPLWLAGAWKLLQCCLNGRLLDSVPYWEWWSRVNYLSEHARSVTRHFGRRK
jgi:hypothetical protein